MANLKRSLKEAVRKLAYSTSVDQLKKRGVTKVNVLGIDRVVALIDEAVHRSLRDEGGVPPAAEAQRGARESGRRAPARAGARRGAADDAAPRAPEASAGVGAASRRGPARSPGPLRG